MIDFGTKLQVALRDVDVIGTNSLLHLIGMPRTTGNARRIAKIMRSAEFRTDQIAAAQTRGLWPERDTRLGTCHAAKSNPNTRDRCVHSTETQS